MNRALAILAPAFLVIIAACKKTPTPGATSLEAAGWGVYEDDWIRISYPPNSEVMGADTGKQDPNNPMFAVIPPTAIPNTSQGGLAIQLDTKTKGMLLRDALRSEIQEETNKGGILLSGPKDFKVLNGRCLGAVIISAGDLCKNEQGTCYTPVYTGQCDDAAGRRIRAFSVLSRSHSKNALGPEAQREAATYERIMNTLEFKK